MLVLLLFGWTTAGTRSRDEDARFLIQASFGPTRAALDDIASYASYEAWIASQIALNVSSHRVFLRERLHPMVSKLASHLFSGVRQQNLKK